ncbi:MAG TPA: tetratricopeptide repeat protein [Longimicrobiaceae bacterium]|nr:tetratricopeptide repeat protein [Longimicrobiaceae bacterium]
MGVPPRSRDDLPRAPLELLHPLALPPAAPAGVEILSELPAAQAGPLFSLYRAALRWSSSASEGEDVARLERHALARLGEEGCWPGAAVIALHVSGPPGEERDEVALACLCVADWALSQKAPNTALAFAALAAFVWPRHPRYAWTYGRLLRGSGRMREAEQWFRRSHRLAVWLGDWEAQVKSLNSLGVLSYLTGSYRRAETRLTRALAVATKRGLRRAGGEVLHDLFVLKLNRQEFARAEEFAAEALRHYLPDHDRLPALAHDLGCLWMDQGHFERALPLLRAVASRHQDPLERFQTYAAVARAAGGAGDGTAFDWAWARARRAAGGLEHGRIRAAALVDLGRGAASLGRWIEAIESFEEARSMAEKHGEADVVATAEAGMAAAGAERRADAPARELRGTAGSDVVVREVIGALQPVRSAAA